jgi:hypothetical protein
MTRLFIDNLGWYHVPVNVQSLKHSIQSIFIRKYEGTLLVSIEHDPQTSQCKYSTISDVLIHRNIVVACSVSIASSIYKHSSSLETEYRVQTSECKQTLKVKFLELTDHT